jgi:hypothetical protein
MSDVQFGKTYRLKVEDLEIESSLRCSFRIERTTKSDHNKATIEVYNLSQKSRDRITKDRVTVKLEAGYQDRLGLLFSGDILTGGVSHVKNGADWVTKIQAGDGEQALRTSRVNESFGPNTKLVDVLSKMAGKFVGVSADKAKKKIAAGDFPGAFKEFANGFTAAGPLRGEFDTLMKNAGLEWSIQNGEMQVTVEGDPTQETAFEVGPGSGLIGSPEKGDKGAIKFRSLLQSSITPGRRVVLKSRSINATIVVNHVVYVGDTHGDQWFTESEGLPQ